MRIQFPRSPNVASARLNTTLQRYQQGHHSICKPVHLLAPVVTKWMEQDTGPRDPGTGSWPTPSCHHSFLGPGSSGSLPQGRSGSVAGRGLGRSGLGVGRQQLLQGRGPGLTLEMLQAPWQCQGKSAHPQPTASGARGKQRGSQSMAPRQLWPCALCPSHHRHPPGHLCSSPVCLPAVPCPHTLPGGHGYKLL